MQQTFQPVHEKVAVDNYYHKRALSDKEASIYIGMSESFLRHSRSTGSRTLPIPRFIKIGRSVRYLREDLDFWLEQFQKLDHLSQLQVMGIRE